MATDSDSSGRRLRIRTTAGHVYEGPKVTYQGLPEGMTAMRIEEIPQRGIGPCLDTGQLFNVPDSSYAVVETLDA